MRQTGSQASRLKPHAYLRSRTLQRRGIAAALIAMLAVLVLLDRGGYLLVPRADTSAYDGQTFEVVRVIDGDTLDVAATDGDSPTTRIRLWGVDTPEAGRPEAGIAPEPFAEEATAFARELAEGHAVTLHLEPHRPRGNYGRVLAYVELSDGTTLNEQLLLAGLARADDRWPHRHLDRYRMLELQAKRERVGVWAGSSSVSTP